MDKSRVTAVFTDLSELLQLYYLTIIQQHTVILLRPKSVKRFRI